MTAACGQKRRIAITRATASRVTPMSSRTVSSSAARPVASHARCPSRAHTSQARIGTPRVTSWKSQFTIAWKGQESSRAATAARATPVSRAATGEQVHRHGGRGEGQGHDHAEHAGVRPHPVEGGQQREDRVEVVAEDVEVHALDGAEGGR
ncbi:hypothetical protein GY12_12175 [Micrococcus luteus]|nr:hypothetical protein GY12_12175 [Micrococcus luteus]